MLKQEDEQAISQKSISKIKKILGKYSKSNMSVTTIKSLAVKSKMSTPQTKMFTEILGSLIMDIVENDSIYQKVLTVKPKKEGKTIK